jgi:hypothetical protein
MILNRGTCEPVAFVGPAEDEQAQADGEFLAAAREDVPALLAELAAATEVADDAMNRHGQLTADLNAARTENERLTRALAAADSDYRLVVRIDDHGRAQVSADVDTAQVATWLRELLATAEARLT